MAPLSFAAPGRAHSPGGESPLQVQQGGDPAADLLHLTRWQIFNVLVGNADGHAKNLSREIDRLLTNLPQVLDDEARKTVSGTSKAAQVAVDRVITVVRSRIRRVRSLLGR